MNDQEFWDFRQKQRDFEDELKQDRAAVQAWIDKLKREAAAKRNETWEQYLTRVSKKNPVRAKALEVLERRLSSRTLL